MDRDEVFDDDGASSSTSSTSTTADDEMSSGSSSSSSASDDDELSRDSNSTTTNENRDHDHSDSSTSYPPGHVGDQTLDIRNVLSKFESKRRWTQSRTKHVQGLDRRAKRQRADRSSSDEEEEHENGRETQIKDNVDWYDISASSWAGKDCVFQAMPVREISSLVGWATHYTHCGDSGALPESQDLPPSHFESIKAQSTRVDTKNPLLSLTNTPLPPSHLKFLSERAEDNLWASIYRHSQARPRTCSWERHSFLGHSDTDDHDRVQQKKPWKGTRLCKHNQLPWQEDRWTYGSTDETYKLFEGFRKTEKVVVSVPVTDRKPKAQAKPRRGEKTPSHMISSFHCFDQSALVALGMVLEEAMTASLLPLARLHVARCRELGQKKHQRQNKTSDDGIQQVESQNVASESTVESDVDDDPFYEWTLPPSEALTKLLRDYSFPSPGEFTLNEGSVGLPSAFPPTLVNNDLMGESGAHPIVSATDSVLQNLSSVPNCTKVQLMGRSVSLWCKAHDLDPSFVHDNMDLFGMFLPYSPPTRQEPLHERQPRTVIDVERHQAKLAKKLRAAKKRC